MLTREKRQGEQGKMETKTHRCDCPCYEIFRDHPSVDLCGNNCPRCTCKPKPSPVPPSGGQSMKPTGVMCLCCGYESFKTGGYCDYCFLAKLQDSKHQCKPNVAAPPAPSVSAATTQPMKTWSCKIGEISPEVLGYLHGADLPMRKAISAAYREITGTDPNFIFSGWGEGLTEPERAVVENREPSEAHYAEWMEARRQQLPVRETVPVCPRCNRPHYNMEDSAACAAAVPAPIAAPSVEEEDSPEEEVQRYAYKWREALDAQRALEQKVEELQARLAERAAPIAAPSVEPRPLTQAQQDSLKPFIETRKADIALHYGSFHETKIALKSQIEICNDLRERLQRCEEKLVAAPSVNEEIRELQEIVNQGMPTLDVTPEDWERAKRHPPNYAGIRHGCRVTYSADEVLTCRERQHRALLERIAAVLAKADQAPQETKMTAIELVQQERRRQIEKEGWSLEHDDEHRYGALAKQAAALAVKHTDAVVMDDGEEIDPWGLAEKHRNDSVRSLVIAGALIVAEIERLQRADQAPQEERT
jgi:hypothetical protein